MSSFPTPWTVAVIHPLEGTDEYGNDLDGHDFDRPDVQPVYGWSPSGTDEQGGWRRQTTADMQVYAPPGFRCGPADLMVVDGVTYHVEGLVEDYGHGPFGYQPGVRANLKVVSG